MVLAGVIVPSSQLSEDHNIFAEGIKPVNGFILPFGPETSGSKETDSP